MSTISPAPLPVSVEHHSPAQRPTRTRYWLIVFAVTLAIIQYIDRVCISQAAPSIKHDLGFDDLRMGWIFSAFTLAYALFEIPAGYLGDRIGPRKVLARIVLWWSFFTAATGFCRSLGSMIAVRFLFGAGEAGAFPNLTKSFNRWLPTRERTRAQGIMWMSARWGGALTPLLVAFCLGFMNWRHAFVAFSLLGVAWVAIFWFWYRDNPREHSGVNAAEAALMPAAGESHDDHVNVPWERLYSSIMVWLLCFQYACLSYVWYFYVTWLPTYMKDVRGLDIKQKKYALLAGLPLFLGGTGCMLSGWILPRLGKNIGIGSARRIIAVIGFVGAGVMMVSSTRVSNPFLAIFVISMASFFSDLSMPASWTGCMDVGQKYVGTLSGTMNMMGNFGGFIFPIFAPYVISMVIGEPTAPTTMAAAQPSSAALFHAWNVNFYIMAGVSVAGALAWLAIDPVSPLTPRDEVVPTLSPRQLSNAALCRNISLALFTLAIGVFLVAFVCLTTKFMAEKPAVRLLTLAAFYVVPGAGLALCLTPLRMLNPKAPKAVVMVSIAGALILVAYAAWFVSQYGMTGTAVSVLGLHAAIVLGLAYLAAKFAGHSTANEA